MRLENPWFLVLLLPAALLILLRAKRTGTDYRYSITAFVAGSHVWWVTVVSRAMLFLALAATIGALARPVTDGGTIPIVTRVRDTVILIDRSGSMDGTYPDSTRIPSRGAVPAMELSKYLVARLLSAEFIKLRPEDRIMVCVFDDETICPTPLTKKDHDVLLEWLYLPDSIGAGTRIANALIVSLRHLDEMGQSGKRTIILASDGEEYSWSLDLEEEIRQLLRKTNTTLYWVYVELGSSISYNREKNRWYESQHALRRFIAETGGKELEAGSEKAFVEAFAEIKRIATEPALITVPVPRRDLYPFLTGAALAALFAAFAWIRLRIR